SAANYSVNGFAEGSHTWNVACVDNASNVNASATRTFTRDISGPSINLESPVNNTLEETSNTVVFKYNISDAIKVDNCSLIINNRINVTNKTITKETSQNFTVILPDSDYNWSVNCTDTLGNSDASSLFNLSVLIDIVNPTIFLNKPDQGYNTSLTNIGFNFTATDYSGIRNATVWANISGSWISNETNRTSLISGQPALINTTGIEDGNYMWSVYVCDDAPTPNCAFASSNYTLTVDTIEPSVTLDKPEDNYANDSLQYVDITFNGSTADNHYLKNVSLYHNATGTWLLNQTFDVSNIISSFRFNLTDISNVSFTWNIESCDLVGNCNFSSSNRTVILNWSGVEDSIAPNISLVSPQNSSRWTSSSTVTFSYNVSDDSNVTNCSLLIDGSIDQIDTTITVNMTQSFTSTLSNSDYNWSISCSDYYGNLGNSSTYTLAVSYTETSGPSDSPSGLIREGRRRNITVTPEPVEEPVPETIHGCSQDSECGPNQYCFEHKCHDAECFEDIGCEEGESCLNHSCTKWSDVKMIKPESPVKTEDFFDSIVYVIYTIVGLAPFVLFFIVYSRRRKPRKEKQFSVPEPDIRKRKKTMHKHGYADLFKTEEELKEFERLMNLKREMKAVKRTIRKKYEEEEKMINEKVRRREIEEVKEQADKLLRDVKQDKVFWVNNGQTLSNMESLQEALKSMNDHTFAYHVNKEKNDFAAWITEVIGDRTLAMGLAGIKNRNEYLKRIEQRIHYLKEVIEKQELKLEKM
ncbi:hypothetical protein JXA85_01840, partial [Candidatus Woesearchaeota archaeon]|nr:hypothetical protein [Candidatus Woesearchaeota archaeon]